VTDAIDATFVPVTRATVEAVELDGELLIHDTDLGGIHRLDQVGALVWRCFDDRATVAELVADLAAGFHADPAQVRADVEHLTKTLLSAGLLVDPDAPDSPEEPAPVAEPMVLTNPPVP
jgi:hypothetical protein